MVGEWLQVIIGREMRRRNSKIKQKLEKKKKEKDEDHAAGRGDEIAKRLVRMGPGWDE